MKCPNNMQYHSPTHGTKWWAGLLTRDEQDLGQKKKQQDFGKKKVFGTERTGKMAHTQLFW